MGRQTRRAGNEPRWFLSDRPIETEQDDRLGSTSLARTLVEAIASAEPPCMIGLLGGFGSGKSSVTSLASLMLDDSRFDSVTASADKHSGALRARNLVHAIAGELQGIREIDSDEVKDILRPLRQSTQVTAPDPTDTTWARMRAGRYSFKRWLKAMAPPLCIGAVVAGAAVLAGGVVKSGSIAAAVTLVLGWFLYQMASWWADAVKGLSAAASLTDHTPRAEAADEIEEVFGQLVDLHKKKRPGRRLVVFVDDIDRLSKDDLLDALRSLRSLQSVPRGAEPVFVISCDEAILRSAVGESLSHPATAAEHDTTAVTDSSPDGDTDGSDTSVEGRSATGSEHDHPALAFVDKLLTARVQMPPAMGGDMRRFALRAIGDSHPLRAEDGIDIDQIVSILIHDKVSNPRSAIRLINRFIAAYLLAKDREARGEVALGDITDHSDVLAQLCVLLDEYPQFYEAITDNTVLLSAARKVALRNRSLTASEDAALRHCSADFIAVGENNGGTAFEFVRPSLRRFLSSSARRVSLPTDIGPLVYFMATPGGRVLGAQVRLEIVSGVQSGDHEDLARVLSQIPEDQINAAAGEIEQRLHDALAVDASTYVAAVAPNLHHLKEAARGVGDACADLLDQSPEESIPAPLLTEIISHTGPERHDLLCERLVRPDEATDSTNSRMVHTAKYLAQNPQIRALVEDAVSGWVATLPQEGSWGLARTWLDAAAALHPDSYKDLRRKIAVSLVGSVRSEDGLTSEDADHLVSLAGSTISDEAGVAPSASDLAAEGPITRSAFVRLWHITHHEGESDDALLAARAGADADIEPAVRMLAIRHVADWVDEWIEAEWLTEQPEDSGEACDVIVASLAEAARDPAVLTDVAEVLPDLAAALGPQADDLMSAISEAVLENAGEDPAADRAAAALMAAVQAVTGTEHERRFDQHATRMFDAIDSDSDPSDPAVQMALRLVPVAVQADLSETILGPQVHQWSDRLIGAGDADHRNRLAGLRAAFDVDTSLIEHQAQAQHILDQTHQLINGGNHPEDRLRTLARFPWPDPQVEPALSAINQHWEQFPEDARVEAFELVMRAPDEFELLARFHDRIAKAVQADPHGHVSRIAASEIKRMRPAAARLVLGSAVGRHEAVTAEWNALDEDAAAQYLVQQPEAAIMTRLLDELRPNDRAAAAAAAMTMTASTAGIPEEAVRAVASYCDGSVLAQAAQAAVATISEQRPETISALLVVIAARENHAEVNTDLLQEKATALLPGTTPDIAGLLGRSLKGTRQTTKLRAVLRDLRRGEASQQSLVGAFDAAYES